MFWWPLSLYFLKPACRITLPSNTAYACCLGCVQVRIISQRKSAPKYNRLLQTSWWRERSLAKTNTWSSIALPLPPSLNPTIPASIIKTHFYTCVPSASAPRTLSHFCIFIPPFSVLHTPLNSGISSPLCYCAFTPKLLCKFSRVLMRVCSRKEYCFEEYWRRTGSLLNANVSFRRFILYHGRDNHNYECLLAVEVPETSENTALSFKIHYSSRGTHSFWPNIIEYIIWYYIDIIELQETANGIIPFGLHFSIQSGLQGLNTDRLSWQRKFASISFFALNLYVFVPCLYIWCEHTFTPE